MNGGKKRKAYPAASLPLSVSGVSSYLNTATLGSTMAVMQAVDSTSSYIKRCVSALDDGFTVISERQYGGRGRRGKCFVSPEGGLYMSILLIDRGFCQNPELLTVRSAVAVKNAIKELTMLSDIGIKWVNDIYCGNKKICGILAESIIRKRMCDFCVLGIGINVTTGKSDFHGELSSVAGSISDFTDVNFSRNELAAKILNNLEKTLFVTDRKKSMEILDDYRSSSVIIGKEIYLIKGEESVKVKVLGIDDFASLYVQYGDGRTEILRSGEVSTRIIGKESEK